MAVVYVTVKIMPESPDSDLSKIEESAKEVISRFGGNIAKVEQEPVAFGLKAVKIIFSMDEKKGSTDPLEDLLRNLDEVESVEVVDVRRGIG